MTRTVALCASLLLFGACSAGTRAGAPPGAAAVAVRWRWSPTNSTSVGAPAADPSGVAVTYGHERVALLEPDGRVRWEAARVGVREQPPRLTADAVLVPTDDGALVALARGTGAVRWDTKVAGDYDDVAMPVVVGGLAVASVDDGSVVAVDLASGRVAWRRTLPGRADGPTATDGHQVLVSWEPERDTVAGLTALDAATGVPRWTAALRAGGVSAPAVVQVPGGPFAVVVDDDLAAKAFDLADGRQRWASPIGGAGSPEVPPLAGTDGSVLVADRLAGLTLFDADGKEMWRARAHGVAVHAGPAGPALDGQYALPLYAGNLMLAGPGRGSRTLDPPGGLANGVATAPGGGLYVTTAQGTSNQLVAYEIRSR